MFQEYSSQKSFLKLITGFPFEKINFWHDWSCWVFDLLYQFPFQFLCWLKLNHFISEVYYEQFFLYLGLSWCPFHCLPIKLAFTRILTFLQKFQNRRRLSVFKIQNEPFKTDYFLSVNLKCRFLNHLILTFLECLQLIVCSLY